MLKVSASSQSKSVAGAISHTCREHDAPSILAAGAAAINTAIKAIAIARMNLTEDNIELSCAPALTDKVSMGMFSTRVCCYV
jgi:stage V sporulation protein S